MNKNYISLNELVKMLKNLKIHFDLYAEIIDYLLAGNVYKRALISEQGYDVKMLCENYGLSVKHPLHFLSKFLQNLSFFIFSAFD